MTVKITADDIIEQMTKSCQRAAEKRARTEVIILKKNRDYWKRQAVRFEGELKQYKNKTHSKLKSVLLKQRRVQQREDRLGKAITYLSDQFIGLEKLKKQTIEDFLKSNTTNRNYWGGQSGAEAARRARQSIGSNPKTVLVPKKIVKNKDI